MTMACAPDSQAWRARAACSFTAFITFTAIYVYAIGTTVELGENYRYRFLVEPLFLVLAVTAATQTVRSRILTA